MSAYKTAQYYAAVLTALFASMPTMAGASSAFSGRALIQETAAADCIAHMRARPLRGQETVFEELSPALACFDGRIQSASHKAMQRLRAWAEAPVDLERALVIRSLGGGAEAGVEAAEIISAAGIDVYVTDLCLSSCANYFYAGVKRRRVLGKAVVGFHGGIDERVQGEMERQIREQASSFPPEVDVDEVVRKQIEQSKKMQERQDRLLENAGASLKVIYGIAALQDDDLEMCGSSPDEASTPFVYFTSEQQEKLGLSPVSGALLETPDDVRDLFSALGFENVAACRVKDSAAFFSQ